eukprot:gene53002-29638_t
MDQIPQPWEQVGRGSFGELCPKGEAELPEAHLRREVEFDEVGGGRDAGRGPCSPSRAQAQRASDTASTGIR